MNDHRPATDPLCAGGHRHAHPSSGDTRYRAVEHSADLLAVCDDGPDHDHVAYVACLRFVGSANSPGVADVSVRQ